MNIKVIVIGTPDKEALEKAIIEFQTKKGTTKSAK